MKKIIILLMLFFPILLLGEMKSNDELMDEISKIIVNYKSKILNTTDFKILDLWWSSVDWAHKNSEARYKTYLKKGFTYIIYTYTSGPKVKGCFKYKGGTHEICSILSNNIIFYYRPNLSGKYYYYVRSKTDKIGIHVSYLTMLYDKNLDEKKIIKIEDYITQDWE